MRGIGVMGAVFFAAALGAAPAAAEDAGRQFRFSGDLRVRHDMLTGKVPQYSQFTGFAGALPTAQTVGPETVRNDSLLTNRLGLNVDVKPAEGVSLHTRFLMYKHFGHADAGVTQAGLFADRQNAVFDGTIGHVPSDNDLVVDRAYATVNELFGLPVWFSAGRRPSTGGAPTNVRRGYEVSGSAGTPGLMVDYAFDGFTLGAAPEVAGWEGLAAKLCAGRAYDGGYWRRGQTTKRDTDMLGLNLLAWEDADRRLEAHWQRGFNIMDNIPGPNVAVNLGDIDWFGGTAMQAFRGAGPGDLHVFFSGATSNAMPDEHRYNAGFGAGNPGLLCSGAGCSSDARGYAVYLGGRYDLTATRTSMGAEYNRGSKDWITFVPAGDDPWTSKLGARGDVYELYAAQDLGRAPLTKDGKVTFRLGWQYYDFRFTGSNNWVGEPKVIDHLTLADMQFMAPVKSAYDVYTSFEVRF